MKAKLLKHILLLSFISNLFAPPLIAQTLVSKVWDKRYGGDGNETKWALANTTDGGYLLGGGPLLGKGGDKTEESKGGNGYWFAKIAELTPPSISAQPISKTITGGQNASFTVAANGTGLTYQWQVSKDGGSTFSSITDGLGYSGATTATLSITKAPISMSGYRYRAQVSNGSTSTSSTAALIVNVSAFDNTGVWQVIGTSRHTMGTVTGAAPYFTSLALDPSGTPHVVYADGSLNGRATMIKFDGSAWENVGIAGFSAGSIQYPFLAIDANGVSYVAFQDVDNGNRVSVMKWSGDGWEMVGSAGFSAGPAYDISLALDPSGFPLVAYQDGANGGRATVMEFNGDNWGYVGSAGFSAGHIWGATYYVSLVLDSNGTPYVAYADGTKYGRLTVMRFNGGAWENVGSSGFSASSIQYPSLAIDTNGVPYVAYKDVGISVMRFKASQWELVGNAGFSGNAFDVSLALDASGTPYVAFANRDNGFKASAMKFNGSSWENIGNVGISTDRSKNLALTVGANNVPYIVYREALNNNKVVAVKFGHNSPPTAISLSSTSVDENTAAGTVVGTFAATDADPSGLHAFSLVTGEGSEDNISFNIEGNRLIIREKPDYATKSSYSIRVRTDDGTGGIFERVFIIQVTDPDEILLELTNVTIASSNSDATKAKVGDVVTVSLTSNKPLQVPEVTIAGHAATVSPVGTSATQFIARYTMTAEDAEGQVLFGISYHDAAESTETVITTTSNGSGVIFDKTLPDVTISSTVSSPFSTNLIPLTLTFSEVVTGLEVGDFNVVNGLITRIATTDNRTYTVDLIMTLSGTAAVSVSLPASRVVDAAFNSNTVSNTWTGTFDSIRPIVILSTPAATTVNAAYSLTVTFSKEVNGFTLEDITVVNGIASDFTAVGATVYKVKITPTNQGVVSVSVGSYAARDAASNGNTSSSVLYKIFDSVAPSGYKVTFNQTEINYGNEKKASVKVTGAEIGSVYNYTITSAEGGTPVTGSGDVTASSFDISDINLSGLRSGQLTLTLKLTDEATNTGANAMAQIMKYSRNIAAYTRPANVQVPFCTTFGQLGASLPTTVEVTYADNTKGAASVTWQEESYNGNLAGAYELTGILSPAEGTVNSDNITARITVVVEASRAATAIILSRSDIDENNTVGSLIGTLSTADEDAGDTHTYTLVDGDGSSDNASFTIEENELKAAQLFDFETQSSFSIRIRTTDSGGMTYESTKAITVNDVEDSVTGIAEEENTMLKVYPNPANRFLVVSFDRMMESVRLVDSHGSTVLAKQGLFKQVELNTAALAPGVYIAVVSSKGKVYTRRIVIMK